MAMVTIPRPQGACLHSQTVRQSVRKKMASCTPCSQNVLGLRTVRTLKSLKEYSPREGWEMERSRGLSRGLKINSRPSRTSASASPENFVSLNGARMHRGSETLLEPSPPLSESVSLFGDEGRHFLQAVHDAARAFRSGLEEQFGMGGPWFAQKLFGQDRSARIKHLAYQGAVHSLLSAVLEVASRGQGRSRDVSAHVQRSLLRQLAPLEDCIKQNLSTDEPSGGDWFWTKQHPVAVASFLNLLGKDSQFVAMTTTGCWDPSTHNQSSDLALLTLSVSIAGALTRLDPEVIICPAFSLVLSEEMDLYLDMLSESVHINEVYKVASGVGLQQEFLHRFGPRAAPNQDAKFSNEDEASFWIELVEQLLRQALVREGVCAKLKAPDSVEVLQRDLAIFGFFAALGRKTRGFLTVRTGGDYDDTVASLLRYLEGGSALFYRRLAKLSTYQLFVEVVSEELDWLPFYPEAPVGLNEKDKNSIVGQDEKLVAIKLALAVCSGWVDRFSNSNLWVQRPLSLKATKFLTTSYSRLKECEIVYNTTKTTHDHVPREQLGVEEKFGLVGYGGKDSGVGYHDSSRVVNINRRWTFSKAEKAGEGDNRREILYRHHDASNSLPEVDSRLKSFDKELHNVEKAVLKLEELLEESKRLANTTGKERLIATPVDLEKIRRLKNEIQELECLLEAKSLLKEEQGLKMMQVEDQERGQNQPVSQGESKMFKGADLTRVNNEDAVELKELEQLEALHSELDDFEASLLKSVETGSETGDITFLNGVGSDKTAEGNVSNGNQDIDVGPGGAVTEFLSKSIDKLKDVGADMWRGTKILSADLAAATVLLRRGAAGEELTLREKKILKRTLTDLASAIPIGILMLLPVTAVGHAAILAAIQKYVPSLIPSAYGADRLDVSRQLEQVKLMVETEVLASESQTGATPPLSRKGEYSQDHEDQTSRIQLY